MPSKGIVLLFAPPDFVIFRRLCSLPLFLYFRIWLSIFYLRYDPIFFQRPLCDISEIINMKNTNCHPDPILTCFIYILILLDSSSVLVHSDFDLVSSLPALYAARKVAQRTTEMIERYHLICIKFHCPQKK